MTLVDAVKTKTYCVGIPEAEKTSLTGEAEGRKWAARKEGRKEGGRRKEEERRLRRRKESKKEDRGGLTGLLQRREKVE